jgi:DNA-binding response OmpR family regulator
MDNTAPPQSAPFKRLHIISTEDDTLIRLILAELVSPEGHEMQFARNSDDLFNLMSKKSCDLLILDVNVPGMNGYQIAREVCARYKEKRPKILIFTGRDTEAEKGLALVSGADAVLKKGCPLELLLETINQLGGNGKPKDPIEASAAKAPEKPASPPIPPSPAMWERIDDLEKSLRGLEKETASLGERMERMAPRQG